MLHARKLGAVLLASGALVAQGERSNERKPDALRPGLLSLSRELTQLKEHAKSRIRISIGGRRTQLGIYLGDGIIASAYVPDTKAGQTAVLRSASGTYRAIALGPASRRMKLVSFYRLRDWPGLSPEPALPKLSTPDWRDAYGDLVCIVGERSARVALVDDTISVRWRRHSRSSGAGNSAARYVFGYGMNDAASTSGASVLAVDGSLIGMLVRRTFRDPREAKKKSAGPESVVRLQKGTPERRGESSSKSRDVSVVIDARWLQARAKHCMQRPLAVTPQPSLGVSLRDRRAMAAARARREKARAAQSDGGKSSAGKRQEREGGKKQKSAPRTLPEPGLLVTRVAIGSPAARAGVRVGDFWLRLDGKPLENISQIRDTMAGLAPGQMVSIGFRRNGRVRDLMIAPN